MAGALGAGRHERRVWRMQPGLADGLSVRRPVHSACRRRCQCAGAARRIACVHILPMGSIVRPSYPLFLTDCPVGGDERWWLVQASDVLGDGGGRRIDQIGSLGRPMGHKFPSARGRHDLAGCGRQHLFPICRCEGFGNGQTTIAAPPRNAKRHGDDCHGRMHRQVGDHVEVPQGQRPVHLVGRYGGHLVSPAGQAGDLSAAGGGSPQLLCGGRSASRGPDRITTQSSCRLSSQAPLLASKWNVSDRGNATSYNRHAGQQGNLVVPVSKSPRLIPITRPMVGKGQRVEVIRVRGCGMRPLSVGA
jgi:hypothetical protein